MQNIALPEIIINNPYLRIETDIASLMKSIETVGLINPITINKENELIAGGRRYQAIKELGWTEVPVQVVDRNKLEQELISIDENLVRKPLNKLEFENCLNRGREIYEELNPLANRIEMEIKTLSPAQKKQAKEAEENDNDSFAAVTSEKTGLSKSVIKGAIKRDALSSNRIKEARGEGDLSASQVNEIIKLKKEEQDKILPHIQNRPVKEVRKIVEVAKNGGIEAAIETSNGIESIPREFLQLGANSRKVNKILAQILLEDIDFNGADLNLVIKSMRKLREHADDFLSRYDEEDYSRSEQNDYVEESSIQ
jgi:ParB family transcriptional regulator, chromosome partitioning protein